MRRLTILALTILSLVAMPTRAVAQESDEGSPTVREAREFMDDAEERLLEVSIDSSRAAWVQSTYITHDTEIIAAQAREKAISTAVELAKEATRFDDLDLSDHPTLARKFELLKRSLTLPAPSDPAMTKELTEITTRMESTYGKGEYCPQGDSSLVETTEATASSGSDEGATNEDAQCLALGELTEIMAESRDPEKLQEAWVGWRTISPPMRDDYRRYVELANAGARELGFVDLGALWRSGYDMDPDAFAAELDRLWGQVRPFYEALHCHVRAELNEAYGDDVVPLDAPIRADLLGNMWAQEWANIYPIVKPEGMAESAVDLTARLRTNEVDARGMVEYGERFFSSLGFEPLPETFWERSLFTKPADRDVVCHASAWNIDDKDDLRIKMCIEITEEDFVTVHHELGHNYYQRAYNEQPYLFRGSANDGFHEAVGDTVALSVTPEYLAEVGLVDEVPAASDDTGLLLKTALDKIAFLPFGLLIDQYRWKIFSGEVSPEEYNQAWWRLRQEYQGIRPPVERGEEHFDPGAKYHIPASVPYTRYFLARILQFQFHRALCEAAGVEGPLHRCSIYGSEEAGRRLAEMLEMGLSEPWPVALEALTGSREMDASAIVDYFRPLKDWLDEQNADRQCGWM